MNIQAKHIIFLIRLKIRREIENLSTDPDDNEWFRLLPKQMQIEVIKNHWNGEIALEELKIMTLLTIYKTLTNWIHSNDSTRIHNDPSFKIKGDFQGQKI